MNIMKMANQIAILRNKQVKQRQAHLLCATLIQQLRIPAKKKAESL